MTLSLISPPAQEPVLLEDLKQHLRLSSNNNDDAALSGFGVAARHALEARAGFAFLAQQWLYQVAGLNKGINDVADIILPITPILSVDKVELIHGNNEREILSPDLYHVMTGSIGRIKFLAPFPFGLKKYGGLSKYRSIEVSFTAGHNAVEDIPAELRHAIRLLTAHFYENRESASEERVFSIPRTIDTLLAPYRRVSL